MPGLDLGNLTSTGPVDAVTVREAPALLGIDAWNRPTREYAMLMKVDIVGALVKHGRAYDALGDHEKRGFCGRGGRAAFHARVFDDWIGGDRLDETVLSLELVLPLGREYSPMGAAINGLPTYRIGNRVRDLRAATEVDVLAAAGELMELLQLSVDRNALLLQNVLLPTAMRPEQGVVDRDEAGRVVESVRVLRAEYGKLIGPLPGLSSIDEVLRLKRDGDTTSPTCVRSSRKSRKR